MPAPFTVQTAAVVGEGGAQTLTIASGVMKAGRLYLLFCGADKGANAAMGAPTSVDQADPDANWELCTDGLDSASVAFSASNREHGAVYRCQPASDVASETITITWSNVGGNPIRRIACIIACTSDILDDRANNGAGCIAQIAINGITGGTASSYSATIPALGLDPDNAIIAAGWSRTGAAVTHTPGTGFTELSDASTALGTTINLGQMVEGWNPTNGDPDGICDMTRDAGANTWGMVAIELVTDIIPGTVYANPTPDSTDVSNAASDHYGTTTAGMLVLMDPAGVGGDTFAQHWWGKNSADAILEILMLDRVLQLMRQAGQLMAPMVNGSTFYLFYQGGDILSTCLAGDGRRYWAGGDCLGSNALGGVDRTTNTWNDPPSVLPIARNSVLAEHKNAELDVRGNTMVADALGAGYRSHGGAGGTSNFTPNQGTYPGTLYWTLDIMAGDASTIFYACCVLVESPTGQPSPKDHETQDTHILAINAFGAVSSTATFGLAAGDNFAVQMLKDTTYTYVYFREWVPPYGVFTPAHLEDVTTDTTYLHAARVLNTAGVMATGHTGTVYDDYEWWDGSAWSSDYADSVRMVDVFGADISGDSAVTKYATGHYVMTAQEYTEPQRRVYLSANPQGPWTLIGEHSLPLFGEEVDTDLARCAIHAKVYNAADGFPVATGKVLTMHSMMTFAVGPSPGSYPRDGRHIGDADGPHFLEVSAFGVDQTITGSASVVNVVSVPGTLDIDSFLAGSPSVVDVVSVGGELDITYPLTGSPSIVDVVSIGGELEQGQPTGTLAGSPSVVNVVSVGGTLDVDYYLLGSPSVVSVESVGGTLGQLITLEGSPSIVNVISVGGSLDVDYYLLGSPSVVEVVSIGGTAEVGSATTRRLYLPVEIERLVSAYLRDQPEMTNVVGDRVYTVIPKPRSGDPKYPLVLVTQIDDDPHDGPLWGIAFSVQISGYGGSKNQAWLAAATARALLADFERFEGVHPGYGVVAGVNNGGMIDLPDESFSPAAHRWLFTSTVTARPSANVSAS